MAGATRTGAGGAAGVAVGVGVGLRRPPLADVGSIPVKSNAEVSNKKIFVLNIVFYAQVIGV